MANYGAKNTYRFQGLVDNSTTDRDGVSDARYKQYIQIIYTPVSYKFVKTVFTYILYTPTYLNSSSSQDEHLNLKAKKPFNFDGSV